LRRKSDLFTAQLQDIKPTPLQNSTTFAAQRHGFFYCRLAISLIVVETGEELGGTDQMTRKQPER
jgi:hypothetical protein